MKTAARFGRLAKAPAMRHHKRADAGHPAGAVIVGGTDRETPGVFDDVDFRIADEERHPQLVAARRESQAGDLADDVDLAAVLASWKRGIEHGADREDSLPEQIVEADGHVEARRRWLEHEADFGP